MTAKLSKDDRFLAAAGGFTGLWAVTWLGTSVMAAGAVVQGGFAVGGVMAGSGLTALWWKTRALTRYQADSADEDAQAGSSEPDHLSRTQKT